MSGTDILAFTGMFIIFGMCFYAVYRFNKGSSKII